jgi:nicotinamide riboside kinase
MAQKYEIKRLPWAYERPITFAFAIFMNTPFVITIVGPESSGKTTLTRELASAIGCSWVPEHARVFLETLNRPYSLADLHELASIQAELIDDALSLLPVQGRSDWPEIKSLLANENGFSKNEFVQILQQRADQCLIIDSGMLTLQQWAAIKYGQTMPVVEKSLVGDITSLYLVTRARHDWEPDPLREAPAFLDRVWIYNRYVQALVRGGKNFYSVNVDVAQVSAD